jgi:hypothetical protein
MVFWHGSRTVHSIGAHLRRAIHTGYHAVKQAVQGAVQAAPHIHRAIEDTRAVYQKVKPLLNEKGYGRHTNAIDTHLSTYDRVRRALE